MENVKIYDSKGNIINNFVQWESERVIYFDDSELFENLFSEELPLEKRYYPTASFSTYGSTKSYLVYQSGYIDYEQSSQRVKVCVPQPIMEEGKAIDVYLTASKENETGNTETFVVARTRIPVLARPKPDNYIPSGTSEYIVIEQLSNQLNLLTGIVNSFQDKKNGKADLVNGMVPADQLPSYVASISTVATFDELPVHGDSNLIYITADTNTTYRWAGNDYEGRYVEVSSNYVRIQSDQPVNVPDGTLWIKPDDEDETASIDNEITTQSYGIPTSQAVKGYVDDQKLTPSDSIIFSGESLKYPKNVPRNEAVVSYVQDIKDGIDSSISKTKSDANDYADDASSIAETNAKNHADVAALTAENNAKAYAKTYADDNFRRKPYIVSDAEPTWESNTYTSEYKQLEKYGYMAAINVLVSQDISLNNITINCNVIFGVDEALSNNYCNFSLIRVIEQDSSEILQVVVFSKTNTAITIPKIICEVV